MMPINSLMYHCIKGNIRISIFWWLVLSMISNVSALQFHTNTSFCEGIFKDEIKLSINAAIAHIGQDFIDNPLITELDLSYNGIKYIAEDAFRKLPNLTTLILSNNDFDTANKFFNFGSHNKLQSLIIDNATRNRGQSDLAIYRCYPNLTVLSLRGNNINNIKLQNSELSESHHFIQPVSLSMQHCAGRSILPKLKWLDLSYNEIRSIEFVTSLPSLRILNLNGNSLSCLMMGREMDNLNSLSLDNNKLKWIRNSALDGYIRCHNRYPYNHLYLTLSGLKNLRYLSVSKNQINSIDPTAFENNIALSYLNLSANDINNLHSDTFAKMEFLQVVDLSLNKLEKVPFFAVNSKNLTFLSLSYNNITKIMPNAFAHTRLKQLLLRENQINEIDVEAFIYLSVLEELDLSYNKLNSLPKGWTASLESLKYLDLSGNKFILSDLFQSLFLTNKMPLLEIYLVNSLEYLNTVQLKTMPQNVTINLAHISDFGYKSEPDIINEMFNID